MAFLSNFSPQFLSLSSHHFSNSSSLYFHSTLRYNHAHFNSSIICFASSKKSSRPSRKLLSDEELYYGLKEFVSSVGLPDCHVPSTKELTKHGRKDLANIVRRRGHKLIEELLANAAKPPTNEYGLWENLDGELSESRPDEEIGQEEKVADAIKESTELMNDEFTVDTSLVVRSESAVYFDNESSFSAGSAVSLQEKVENFMKYGKLDVVDDDGENLDARVPMTYEEGKDNHFTHDSTGLNGALVMESSISPITEKKYKSELSTQSQQKTDFSLEMGSKASEMDNEDEINRLKLMLHQKESELYRLKEEIEKEKKALSVLQTKAEDEINKAQKLITEKEAELLAAEESLSGLVEAKINYSGEGETVEIAGSFNGWHQRIKMDQQISSVIVDPTDSRKSTLWSATLWLYPGVYEMKFIVDGHWKIDPQREITIRHGVENNVLRVDR